MARAVDQNSVFINVPFDNNYEPQFVALVASIVALGRTPRCVLEIQERGQGRLSRIIVLLSTCAVSVHDLSRVGLPPRFNMPFELGLACALQELQPPHAYVLFEKVQHRLSRTLSDLSGRDPYVHRGRVRGIIGCTLDALRSRTANPDPEQVYRLYLSLRTVVTELARRYGSPTIYTRSVFLGLVTAAITLAVEAGFISR
jgi:hypothetical protein